jgi:hypothetical protein
MHWTAGLRYSFMFHIAGPPPVMCSVRQHRPGCENGSIQHPGHCDPNVSRVRRPVCGLPRFGYTPYVSCKNSRRHRGGHLPNSGCQRHFAVRASPTREARHTGGSNAFPAFRGCYDLVIVYRYGMLMEMGTLMPNHAGAVDAPIARVFRFPRQRRRATDQQRSAAPAPAC